MIYIRSKIISNPADIQYARFIRSLGIGAKCQYIQTIDISNINLNYLPKSGILK